MERINLELLTEEDFVLSGYLHLRPVEKGPYKKEFALETSAGNIEKFGFLVPESRLNQPYECIAQTQDDVLPVDRGYLYRGQDDMLVFSSKDADQARAHNHWTRRFQFDLMANGQPKIEPGTRVDFIFRRYEC